jgi:hypothetical protein
MQDYFVRKEPGQLCLEGMMLSEEERKIVERRLRKPLLFFIYGRSLSSL